MAEFVGIGPKNYSYKYLMLDGIENSSSVCKGVPKCVHPEFHEYKNLILNGKDDDTVYRECTRITSRSHSVKTVVLDKVALKKKLRKREKGIEEFETLPYGYFELQNK